MDSTTSPQDMARIHAAAFTQSRPWSQAEFNDLLDSPLVFATGDRRCFALFRVVADEAELLTIATDPVHQRQGLARTTMLEWQNLAHFQGATECFLEVAADNAAAKALYLSQGFACCGKRPDYYARKSAPSVDAIVMRKQLP